MQTVYVWFWTFVGCFCGVSVVQAVFEKCSYFVERNVPGIVGSFVCPPDCLEFELTGSAGSDGGVIVRGY